MGVTRVELVVLGLLAEGPLHGYELFERIRARAMDRWAAVGRASVYQALRRLERDGHVAGRILPGTGGPDRRVSRLTRSGRERLRRGLEERLARSEPSSGEAVVALGFVHLLEPAQARAALAARERAIRDRARAIAQARAAVGADPSPGAVAAGRMLHLQELLAEAELHWLAGVRTTPRRRGDRRPADPGPSG
jgi:DNA-binding PadR family transcriptional regulator